jgi:hypothetical protein
MKVQELGPATRSGARGAAVTVALVETGPGAGWLADTWVFFAGDIADGTMTDRWALGFGPTDTGVPRWALFHCVAEDRFDSRSVCPQLNPSNGDLLRWSTSVVGSATATSLVESVGSCFPFYHQYFAERPDLRGRVA